MCQSKCSPNRHPLSKARKTQALLSVLSWPCAFAAVFTAHGRAEAWVQLFAVCISLSLGESCLMKYRLRSPPPDRCTCFVNIARPEARPMRPSKSLLMVSSPLFSWEYTLRVSWFLRPLIWDRGETGIVTRLLVRFRRSTPTFLAFYSCGSDFFRWREGKHTDFQF